MNSFELVNFGFERLRGLTAFNSDTRLKDGLSLIAYISDSMDSDTALRFTSGNHRFVNAMAIHAFATVSG